MNILVRNEECVTECVLFQATDLPKEEILRRPEVKNFLRGREIKSILVAKPSRNGDPIMVDLELRPR